MTSPSPILGYRPPFSSPFVNVIGLPAEGYFQYWPQIQNLSGGNVETDLDAQTILLLPSNSVLIVVIPNRGLSGWVRVEDTNAPATNVDGGIIRPTGYNSISAPFYLVRQFGF